jgi:hypothetical protein
MRAKITGRRALVEPGSFQSVPQETDRKRIRQQNMMARHRKERFNQNQIEDSQRAMKLL